MEFIFVNVVSGFELRNDLLTGSIKNLINSYKVVASAVSRKPEPLKIMISGAPASGKGTQCELITRKVNLRYYHFIIFCFFLFFSD